MPDFLLIPPLWTDISYMADWNGTTEPAPTLSMEERREAFAKLEAAWSEIAQELAPHTTPLGITGRKSRRLVVIADPAIVPPWGSWSTAVVKEPFARFRKRVNDVISPHEVDHIDFRPSRHVQANRRRRRGRGQP